MTATNQVYLENHFYGADNVHGTGTITVQQDAFVEATGDNGLEIFDGPWKVKVDGYVESDLNGLVFYDPTSLLPNSTVTVGTEGTVLGTGVGFDGIRSELALDVVNSGLIYGAGTGILYENIFHSSSKTISITNNLGGEIRGDFYGIYLDDSNHDLILKNAGIIDEVWWGRGSTITNSGTIEQLYEYSSALAYNNTLTNTGTINQGFGGGHGADVITNSGDIGGSLSLNNGNNAITNKGFIGHSGIDGSIYANEGNDTLTNTGTIDSFVQLGDGINKVTNGGTIGGYLKLGTDNDTVGNTGLIDGYVSLFDGKNALTNGGRIDGDVTFGIGDDMATNTGSISGSLSMGSGNDKVTNSGEVSVDVSLGTGTNSLTNGGHIHGDVFTGKDSNNTISNTKLIDGTFTMIYGDLTLTNSGTIGGDIVTGVGTHKITNSGTFGGSLKTSGSSDDTFINSMHIVGSVDLGDGINIVTNSGTIDGDLVSGGGNDVITSTGHVFGDITPGGGNDKFTGGNFADLLVDGAGNDVYNLGGGNDHIHWVASGNDTLDGGAGTFDQLGAESAGGAIFVNLDTKAVHIDNSDLKASSLVSGSSSSTIKGFEAVFGTGFSDVLGGSTGNDLLYGGDGGDAIYGNKGADDLYGGTNVDVFYYLALTDSGNAKATRDTIHDFEGAGAPGGDKIVLSSIDANTKTANVNDAFHLMGTGDVAFDLTPGCLRWVHEKGTTDMTIIQGDVNGDGKADFSIAVVGIVDFIDTDFSL